MCYYLKYQKRTHSRKLKSWFHSLLSSDTQALGSNNGLAVLVDIVEDRTYYAVTLTSKTHPQVGLSSSPGQLP